MNKQLKNYSRTMLFTTLASLNAGPALAQMVLEEVVVTANKRESNLMDTPSAVSSYDSSTLNELGIDNALDLANHTPSLTVAPSRVSIRGVGRQNLALGSDPGVGLYWDGVYTTETDLFNYSNFLDIDRIEVVRGPQGTLYGRNSIGGAVNLHSIKPNTEEWGGKVIGEYGNYDYLVAQGLASGPVTDKLSVLVGASQIKRDGFQKDVYSGKEYDDRDNSYWTIALDHQTTDRWNNSLKVMDADSDYHQDAGYVLTPYNTGYVQEVFNTSPPGQQLNFVGAYPGTNFANPNQGMTIENPALRNDAKKVAVDTVPHTKNTRKSATFISEYDLDSYSLKYTAGYSEFRFKRMDDGDVTNAVDSGLDYSNMPISGLGGLTLGSPVLAGTYAYTPSMITVPYEQSADTWSHELQLITDLDGDFNYIGGLYYYSSKEKQHQTFIENNPELVANYTWLGNVLGGGLPTDPDGILYNGEGKLKTTSYAVYGQMNWDWSASTVLTLGLRYSYDEKDAKDNTFVQWVVPEDPASPTDPTVYRKGSEDWDKPTWRVGIDHFLSNDHFLYGVISSGYRSGGYNLLAPTTTSALDTVDPEELISYEIGYKGTLMDQRLNLTTALYYYDYSDLQVNNVQAINGVSVSTYENAADATAWGIETEVMALLTENITFSGTYSYNSTEYDNYDSIDSSACTLGPLRVGDTAAPVCTGARDLSGNEFPLTPEHKASANLTYMWDLLSLDWSATVSYQYTGEQELTPFNNNQYDKLDDYDSWNTFLNVGSQDMTWEVQAYVYNISDDRQEIFRPRPSPVSGLAASTLTAPRTYGVKLTYNF